MKRNYKSNRYKYKHVPDEDYDLKEVLSCYSPFESYLRQYMVGDLDDCHETAIIACNAGRVPADVLQDLKKRAPHDGRIRICFSPGGSDTLVGFTEGFCDAANRHQSPLPKDWYSACRYLGSMILAGIPFDTRNAIIKNHPDNFEYRCQFLFDGKQSSGLILFMGYSENFMELFMEGRGRAGKVATEVRLAKYEEERKDALYEFEFDAEAAKSKYKLDEVVQKAFASAATAIQNRINELVSLKPVDEEAEADEQDETQAASASQLPRSKAISDEHASPVG